MGKMKLYQYNSYRSLPCVWLVYELGAENDVEFVTVDSHKKDSPEYKAYVENVHPHGTIPGLEIPGESPLLETSAICLYLADHYGKLAPPLGQRKEYYDWLTYASVTIDEIMGFLYVQWCTNPANPDPEGVKKMSEKAAICMDRLTKTLEGRQWICGNEFTAADCILGYELFVLESEGFQKGALLEKFPKVLEYKARLMSRPAFQKTMVVAGMK